jgi:thioesterase domain-containing protein
VIVFSAARDHGNRSSFLRQSWRPYVAADISVHSIDCSHHELLTTESLAVYGKQLGRLLGRETM